MKVELVKYTSDPERLCAAAALSCHSEKSMAELIDEISKEEIKSILKETMSRGHMSVIEHASFSFSIKDVSRSLTHQLVRHRLASYSQQSQRYVEIENPSYVMPDTIDQDEKSKEEFEEMIEDIWKQYEKFIERGVPEEDARFILPNATTSNITVTMNARELRHFFKLRCCERAQWEIRSLAWEMLDIVRNVAPIIFQDAGPPCDDCPEPDYPCERRGE